MAYRRIHNRGEYGRRDELVAAGTISPGMLCEVTAAGKVQAHSTEGGRAERLVALENALEGKTVSDNYVADDVVQLHLPMPGDVMNMLIQSGQAADPGEELISAGDGTLIVIGSQASSGINVQVIGRLSADETAFTALAANTLKAVRFV